MKTTTSQNVTGHQDGCLQPRLHADVSTNITQRTDSGNYNLRILLSADEQWSMINYLRTAASQFDDDAKRMSDPRVKAQFEHQRDEARTWAEQLEAL